MSLLVCSYFPYFDFHFTIKRPSAGVRITTHLNGGGLDPTSDLKCMLYVNIFLLYIPNLVYHIQQHLDYPYLTCIHTIFLHLDNLHPIHKHIPSFQQRHNRLDQVLLHVLILLYFFYDFLFRDNKLRHDLIPRYYLATILILFQLFFLHILYYSQMDNIFR